MTTIHVDDLLVAGSPEMIEWLHEMLERRFGPTKRNKLPFLHLGVKHCLLPNKSLFLEQSEYVHKIPKIVIDANRKKLADITPWNDNEHHAHRSLLCSMLWVTVTRLDMCLEVVLLQSTMVTPTLGDLLASNAL